MFHHVCHVPPCFVMFHHVLPCSVMFRHVLPYPAKFAMFHHVPEHMFRPVSAMFRNTCFAMFCHAPYFLENIFRHVSLYSGRYVPPCSGTHVLACSALFHHVPDSMFRKTYFASLPCSGTHVPTYGYMGSLLKY